MLPPTSRSPPLQVFPLPVEGTETSVMTDNPEVMNYMIQLSETLEQVRSESFMGWYHSHPFDVAPHSNAFLSATDVSTQLSWQMSEDRAGNPWLALVVDPLRSTAKGRPEIGAFRCYPPSHNPPRNQGPDGKVWADEKARTQRWGNSANCYYELGVEYFVSSLSGALLGVLSREFMWARTLGSTPSLDAEAKEASAQAVRSLAQKVDHANSRAGALAGSGGQVAMSMRGAGGGMSALLGDFRRSSLSGSADGFGASSDGVPAALRETERARCVGSLPVSDKSREIRHQTRTRSPWLVQRQQLSNDTIPPTMPSAYLCSSDLACSHACGTVAQLLKHTMFNSGSEGGFNAALRAAAAVATGSAAARKAGGSTQASATPTNT